MGPVVQPSLVVPKYSNESEPYVYMYDGPEYAPGYFFWPNLFSAISIKGLIPFGVITNAIFLLMVVRVPAMHTMVNIHLSNLAAADMIFLLFMAVKYKTSSVGFWTNVVNYVPYIASMLFVTTVAFGRCFAIYCPFRARAGPTRCRMVKLAVGVWLSSILFSVAFNLLTYFAAIDPLALDILYLSINPTFLSINLVLFASIIIGFRSSQRISSTSLSQRRMLIMLATNTAVFFAFHIAATSFNLYAMFNAMEYITMTTGHAMIFMLLFLNCGVNPLVYGATNADYRKAFTTAFCSFCKNDSEPSTQSNYIEVNDRQIAAV